MNTTGLIRFAYWFGIRNRILVLLCSVAFGLPFNSLAVGASSQLEITAKPAPVESPKSLIPLDVSLVLNEKFLGNINAKISPSTSYGEVDSERLVELLKPIVGKKFYETMVQRNSGSKFVSFDHVSSGSFRIEFDSLALQLTATLGGDEFNNRSLSLRTGRREPNPTLFDAPSKVTAGINVSAVQRMRYRGNRRAFDDPRVNLAGFFNVGGFEGVTIEAGASFDGNADEGEKWVRREIIGSKDFFNSGVRVAAGEIRPSIEGFQGADRMLGVGIFSAYSTIRPFDVVRPTGRREFSLDESARVDIYVNGDLEETIELNAGSYSLQDFPLTNRANDVRLEILGISGERQVIDFQVYGGSELLKPGLIEFGAYAGNREGLKKLRYTDEKVFTGFLRRGINGGLTLGANLQVTDDAQQLGGTATLGNRIGLLQLEAAASNNKRTNKTGMAYGLDYRQQFSIFAESDLRVSANAEYQSEYFQNAFDDLVSVNPIKWRSAIQASWGGLAGLGMSLGVSASNGRGLRAPSQRALDFSLRKSFGKIRVGGAFSVSKDQDGDTDSRFNLTLTYRPSQTYSSSSRFDSSRNLGQFDFRKIASGNLGSYDANLRYSKDDDRERLQLGGGYTHNRFEFDVLHDHQFGSEGASDSGQTELRLASFVGLSGTQIGVGRPTKAGFVLSPVHSSLKDSTVEIRSGGEIIAKSGLFGAPLVPLTRSYSVNRFEVIVDPLPIGYDLGEGVLSTFPGHGNSYRMPIGSDASRTALGFFKTVDGPLALVSGIISPLGDVPNKENLQRPFFTNRSGRFVADRLLAGQYEVIVKGKVIAILDIPKETDGMVNLGVILSE